MRVALFNQMFGLNGRSLLGCLHGHYDVHFRPHRGVRADLVATVQTISKSNADVIGVCEILEGQEDDLARLLGRAGYRSVCFGEGHRTKRAGLAVKVALASFFGIRRVKTPRFPVENALGGGGGIVQAHLPGLGANILVVHFASARKTDLYSRQMDVLRECLSGLRKFVLLGDFNLSSKELKSRFGEVFGMLTLASNRIKTCSMTPVLDIFFRSDLDHIFTKDIRVARAGSLAGRSDHRLVFADLVDA